MEVEEVTKSLESFIQKVVDERLAQIQQATIMRFISIPAAAVRYGRTRKAIERLIEKGTIPTVHLPNCSKPQIDIQVVDALYLPFE